LEQAFFHRDPAILALVTNRACVERGILTAACRLYTEEEEEERYFQGEIGPKQQRFLPEKFGRKRELFAPLDPRYSLSSHVDVGDREM
jgi:hypothetical protein